MYQKILVPLDGSELAECVLPHVKVISEGCDVPGIVLVRIVEPVHLPAGTASDGMSIYTRQDAEKAREQDDSRNKIEAEEYLKQISGKIGYVSNLQTEVIMGRAAESITEYAEKNSVDLIIMATHGRSGVSRWVFGSTADKVMRSSSVPVLLIRAPGCVSGI